MGKVNETEKSNQGETPLCFDLRLRSLKSARQSYARLIRERARGNVPDKDFKSILWGLNGLLAYLKAESEEDFEIRLQALEAAARGKK